MINDIPSGSPAQKLPWDVHPRPAKGDDTSKIHLSSCSVVREGSFFLIFHGVVLLNWENDGARVRGYDYLRQALDILAPGRPANTDSWRLDDLAKWKTYYMLVTLRQGIRENLAQGMGFDLPKPGASEATIRAWLANARVLDAKHHGQATF